MRAPALLALVAAGCGGTSAVGSGTAGPSSSPPPCPAEVGLCAVLVENDCTDDPCTTRGVSDLDALEIVRLEMGVEVDGSAVEVSNDESGVFFASLEPGTYRVRPPGDRFRGFTATIEDAPIVVDTRSLHSGGGVLVGHVRIEVGGGADGNATISQGGPGKHLLASVIPYVDDAQLDRERVRFAVTDEEGRFALRLPAGRYYVSDIAEANESGAHVFGPNLTPIRGREATVADGETVGVELVASELAP